MTHNPRNQNRAAADGGPGPNQPTAPRRFDAPQSHAHQPEASGPENSRSGAATCIPAYLCARSYGIPTRGNPFTLFDKVLGRDPKLERKAMRTFPLKTIWHKTVQGTDLSHLHWNEIAACLAQAGVIALVPAPDTKTFDRYTVIHPTRFRTKSEFKSFILEILRRELARESA